MRKPWPALKSSPHFHRRPHLLLLPKALGLQRRRAERQRTRQPRSACSRGRAWSWLGAHLALLAVQGLVLHAAHLEGRHQSEGPPTATARSEQKCRRGARRRRPFAWSAWLAASPGCLGAQGKQHPSALVRRDPSGFRHAGTNRRRSRGPAPAKVARRASPEACARCPLRATR